MGVTDEGKRKPGRPRKYAEKRPTWTVRLPISIGEEVAATAKAEGRSVSEEIEWRVAKASELERLLEEATNLLSRYQKLAEEQGAIAAALRAQGERIAEAEEARLSDDVETILRANGYTPLYSNNHRIWFEPGADITAIASHLDTATLIGKLDNTFVRALAEEISASLSRKREAGDEG